MKNRNADCKRIPGFSLSKFAPARKSAGGVAYAVRTRIIAVRSGVILGAWGLSTDYDDQIEPESFDEGARSANWEVRSFHNAMY